MLKIDCFMKLCVCVFFSQKISIIFLTIGMGPMMYLNIININIIIILILNIVYFIPLLLQHMTSNPRILIGIKNRNNIDKHRKNMDTMYLLELLSS